MAQNESGEPGAATPLELSEPERRILRELVAAPAPELETELASSTGLSLESTRGALQRLRSKHLARLEEEHLRLRELTERGESALKEGLPERRLLDELSSRGDAPSLPEAASPPLREAERSAAIGVLRRYRLVEDGFPLRLRVGIPDRGAPTPEEVLLRTWGQSGTEPVDEVAKRLERRGLVRTVRRTIHRWSASEEGRAAPLAVSEALGALTASMLRDGSWSGRPFRAYDVRAPVPFTAGARPHPYVQWLEEFEEILIGLGFQEVEGPLIETEFWNSDVLFMPQDHPARSVQDVLYPRGLVGHPPPERLLGRVAAAHEGRRMPGDRKPLGPGWIDHYDRGQAARPVLRSQTTAVSARFLSGHPAPPFRAFSLDRVYRFEALDASHHIEFQQCEGVIGGEGISLRHLIGIFQACAEALGIPELKIRPSYFPFTEPSIEGYVRHPRLGWMEIFPGGMMRPEVLRPLEVEVPVAAWGIGIARLAMVSLGVNDIRELFEDDLGRLQGRGE